MSWLQVVGQVRLVWVEVQIVPQDLVNSLVAEIKSLTDVPDGNCLVSCHLPEDMFDSLVLAKQEHNLASLFRAEHRLWGHLK